jgi:hypothetical protein
MALGREQQHEGPASKLSGLTAPAGKLADKATAAPGQLVEKVASSAKDGAPHAGHLTRDLGKTLSPKRLLRRAAVAATLALIRRHLGVVGAAAGTLVAIGAAGYYAGRRSARP